jgi:hypothetical protein
MPFHSILERPSAVPVELEPLLSQHTHRNVLNSWDPVKNEPLLFHIGMSDLKKSINEQEILCKGGLNGNPACVIYSQNLFWNRF